MSQIAQNLCAIREQVAQAARRSGRKPEDVLLLAVSKTKPVSAVQEAIACGQHAFGENKVQEIMDKYDAVGPEASWHLIGHLQTNKVKYIVDKVAMIHSVESVKLAEEIEKRAAAKNICVDILVEINIAAEESKFGIQPKDTESFLRQIALFPHIRIRGLMTVAPFVLDAEQNRVYFRQMRQLLVDMNAKKIDNVNMDTLSMGMSGDFQVAIEEGATIVRVGTSIFGERDYAAAARA